MRKATNETLRDIRNKAPKIRSRKRPEPATEQKPTPAPIQKVAHEDKELNARIEKIAEALEKGMMRIAMTVNEYRKDASLLESPKQVHYRFKVNRDGRGLIESIDAEPIERK